MKEVILLGVASGYVSYIISEAFIFKGFREWVNKKNSFLGKLFSCGLCTGTYISFFLEAVFLPNLFFGIFGCVVTSFVIGFISATCWIVTVILLGVAGK